MININLTYSKTQISNTLKKEVKSAHQTLHQKNGKGHEFLGWLNYPVEFNIAEFRRVKEAAKKIRESVEVLVVCGIGGSYLGARAAIEAIKGLYPPHDLEIIYMGNTFSSLATNQLLTYLSTKKFAVNVISKSGTTTETAIAFRLLKELLEKRHGRNAKNFIYATTDAKKGVLRDLAVKEGYETFTIPDDIGGRYSVLTSVGLLPIAAAGIDVEQMMYGAEDAYKAYNNADVDKNICYQYAATRIELQRTKKVEVLISYEPHLLSLAEWWKQLYGESEGKDGKGLFPASMIFSTDLHSLGQYIQDGQKILFETILVIKNPKEDVIIPNVSFNPDGLNYLAGKSLNYVNEKAYLGTLDAHYKEGDVPCIIIELDKMDAYTFGYLVYFFEKACAISGYLNDVNPFIQDGVEIYKKNMFKLLGKK